MIKIVEAKDIDKNFFEGRDFADSLEVVKTILADVKNSGDDALHEYGAKFDVCSPEKFEIEFSELECAAKKMQTENSALYDSIVYSHDLALRFAKKQRECFSDFEIELEEGLFTGQKNIPVERAGVYVPAGRFPLVSTVIMTVTPAVAAGVNEIVMCTPPRLHPDEKKAAHPYADEKIMAAAYICGAKKIFACGGAQAIAAMALGTQSIPKCDVIVGPGNKFVVEAKRLVYGTVGIDMLAGPSEVFIIADKNANAKWVAADLLAQAEHDIVAQPILATDDFDFAKKVQAEIEIQLENLPTKKTARESIENCGRIIVTSSLEEAAQIANKKAPEHLELALDEGVDLEKIKSLVHNYGSLFIGHGAAEVFGDYAAGLNHTLPTGGSAKFTGGLSVRCFLKTVTTLRTAAGKKGVIASANAAGILGEAEGLAGHARAARLRLGK